MKFGRSAALHVARAADLVRGLAPSACNESCKARAWGIDCVKSSRPLNSASGFRAVLLTYVVNEMMWACKNGRGLGGPGTVVVCLASRLPSIERSQ